MFLSEYDTKSSSLHSRIYPHFKLTSWTQLHFTKHQSSYRGCKKGCGVKGLEALCRLRPESAQFFQKLGFWASLLWKFSYHLRMQLDGMKVSVGLGVIWAWDTAKEAAKLYRLSSIF